MRERGDKSLVRRQIALITLIVVLSTANPTTVKAETVEAFPRPTALLPSVEFWKQVYTTYSVGDFVLHDRERVGLVYEVVRVKEHTNQGLAARQAEPGIQRIRAKYARLLTSLAKGMEPEQLGPDGVRLADAWGCPCQPKALLKAAGNIRVQQGLREKVTEGLERARRLMPQVLSILREHDLPTELGAIPLVESAFNDRAQSKVAAVGLWQFMKSTGKRYLKISRKRDDRRDPIRSTEGAAHLLRDNYTVLGSWPLAVVAYNHGAGGMRTARRVTGSMAIDEILANYAGRRFGFASKNYYPEFLAAVDVLEPILRGESWQAVPMAGAQSDIQIAVPVAPTPGLEPMIDPPIPPLAPGIETTPHDGRELSEPEAPPPTNEPSI
jgi:peptidoglycan lytic transglycosylase D